ncbi:hypothetical protein V6Z12_D11G234700 [Gossypium hirsutum]
MMLVSTLYTFTACLVEGFLFPSLFTVYPFRPKLTLFYPHKFSPQKHSTEAISCFLQLQHSSPSSKSPKSLYSNLLCFRLTKARFIDLFLVYLPPNQWDNNRFCNHYGPGQIDTRRYGEQYASKEEDADCALLPEQTPFYKDLATVAVQAGVCVDIFAVTNEYTDLASLKFLSIESGGFLFLYANTDDSTLPQDMYRMLSRPYAFNCILRLRTSTEFKLGHSTFF